MNAELAIGLVIGLFLGGTIAGVFLGNLAHQHYEKYKAALAVIFQLDQTIIHLEEGRTRPLYELATDGIDPVVRLRRPLDEQEPLRSSPESSEGTIDLTWADTDE